MVGYTYLTLVPTYHKDMSTFDHNSKVSAFRRKIFASPIDVMVSP